MTIRSQSAERLESARIHLLAASAILANLRRVTSLNLYDAIVYRCAEAEVKRALDRLWELQSMSEVRL